MATNTFWTTSKPTDSLLIPDIPGVFRNHVVNTVGIIEREHATLGTAANTGGEHSLGAAVLYVGTTAPTNRPDGSTALASNNIDKGRLWLDTNYTPPALKYWDGDSFETLGLIGHATQLDFILKNREVAFTDGTKESIIHFRGMETTNEIDLAHITVSHEGTSDDHKGQVSIKVNDGDDGTSPSKEALRIKSTGKIGVANSLCVLDEDDMTSDDAEVLVTQQSIKAFAGMVPAVTGAGAGYTTEESITFPNGLILKGNGTGTVTSGNTITFGTAFPTLVNSITATAVSGSAPTNGTVVTSVTTSNFVVHHGVGGSPTVYWIAFGY